MPYIHYHLKMARVVASILLCHCTAINAPDNDKTIADC
jgi:hypothetical protein